MGFFKNLFSGNFKEIAHQAVKNISNGQLIKGGGIIGNLINTGVNTVTGGALTKIKATNVGSSVTGNVSGTRSVNGTSPPSFIRPLSNQKAKTTQNQNDDFGDVNVNGNQNILIYIFIAVVVYYFIKKR